MNDISFNGHSKVEYIYGSCIPISDIVYNRLKQKGYNPKIVVGWVEIFEGDLLPDRKFLRLFYPKEYRKLLAHYKQTSQYSCDYPQVLNHTWVEVKGHRIDLTKSQFDIYGGIYQYYSAYIDIPSEDKKGRELHTIKKYKKCS